MLIVNKSDYLPEEFRLAWADYFIENGIDFYFVSAKQEQQKIDEEMNVKPTEEGMDKVEKEKYGVGEEESSETLEKPEEKPEDAIDGDDVPVEEATQERVSESGEKIAEEPASKETELPIESALPDIPAPVEETSSKPTSEECLWSDEVKAKSRVIGR